MTADRSLMFPHPCPYCGALNDATMHAGDGIAAPDPGDRSVCAYCASVAVFDRVGDAGALTTRCATADEQLDNATNPEVQRAVAAVHMMIEARR